MLLDLAILFVLLLMNGFFAMAEMAIVSAKRPRLKQLADETNSKRARRALELADNPGAYLSVVQVGVTLNTILAGAFSGATMAEAGGLYLNSFSWITPYGEPIALFCIVGGVGYLTLIIGELVPKRIALAYAEPIALHVVGIMSFLARLTAPLIWLLNLSTEFMLEFFGLNKPSSPSVTAEEVKTLIAEGTETGVFKPAEKDLLEGVMRMADWTVRTIMTPRIDMVWLGIEDRIEDSLQELCTSGYSRFPVAQGDMETVLGIVHAKELLPVVLSGQSIDLKSFLRQPLFVPDTTSILRLLDMFKQSGQHLAIIIDEYGSVEGMVTATDILEAITGALPEDGQEAEAPAVRRDDGSWLIDGMTPIDEVETIIGMKNLREDGEFHTIAGFMIDKLGRIPAAGDFFYQNNARFEVVDMDGRRVDKVLIAPPAPDHGETAENS